MSYISGPFGVRWKGIEEEEEEENLYKETTWACTLDKVLVLCGIGGERSCNRLDKKES